MALTPEQEQALDQLVIQMRQAQPKPAPQPDNNPEAEENPDNE